MTTIVMFPIYDLLRIIAFYVWSVFYMQFDFINEVVVWCLAENRELNLERWIQGTTTFANGDTYYFSVPTVNVLMTDLVVDIILLFGIKKASNERKKQNSSAF